VIPTGLGMRSLGETSPRIAEVEAVGPSPLMAYPPGRCRQMLLALRRVPEPKHREATLSRVDGFPHEVNRGGTSSLLGIGVQHVGLDETLVQQVRDDLLEEVCRLPGEHDGSAEGVSAMSSKSW
jgi:hypothetical protein